MILCIERIDSPMRNGKVKIIILRAANGVSGTLFRKHFSFPIEMHKIVCVSVCANRGGNVFQILFYFFFRWPLFASI